MHHEVSGYQRQADPVRRQATGYQREAGHGMRAVTEYHHKAGPLRPGLAPETEWFEDDSSPDEDSLWMAGQVLTLADDRAAQIAREAHDAAAAIRAAAEREAAAIRETAERETAELRARLDSMIDQLGQVVAAYITETLDAPEMPATAPAGPRAEPAPAPATPAPAPATPRTGPARKKTQNKPGRQKNAMRFARYGTAAMLIFALAAGAVEIGQHGLGFFVFREGGQGQSGGNNNSTDPGFLAQQAAAAHHPVPTGRHHKTSQ